MSLPPDPFAFFSAIYCINLDRRTDRWARTERELARVGIRERVLRVSAVEHADGHEGCWLSHVEVIRRAEQQGLENVLVFEDDVTFTDFSRARLARAIEQVRGLPWDLFFLGARPMARPTAWYPDLVRAPFVQTHAYAIHRRAFVRAQAASLPFDSWWAQHLRGYCVSPPIAEQADGEYSDVDAAPSSQGAIMRRDWRLFIASSYPEYLARYTALRARRAVGGVIVRGAAHLGVKLAFERGLPRIVR
jgi:hypothetical protein